MPKFALANPRNKILNFRLTESEYDDLKAACAEKGGRCLSDFARAAVLTCAQSSCLANRSVQHRLVILDEKLSSLDDRIQTVLDRLDLP